jgi:hypothetical protein
MEQLCSIFTLFGGIRPMARALGESPSKVMAWKRAGHIPRKRRPKFWRRGWPRSPAHRRTRRLSLVALRLM